MKIELLATGKVRAPWTKKTLEIRSSSNRTRGASKSCDCICVPRVSTCAAGLHAAKAHQARLRAAARGGQAWLDHQYPAIERRAKAEGGEIHWGDETALVSTDVRGRSYAQRGKTP
jgi:hypothetical protein